MKNSITLFLLLIIYSMDAQNLPAMNIVSESGFINGKNVENKNAISGSFLLHDDWVTNAEVYTNNDKPYLPKAINFNVKLGIFIVKIAEDSLFTLDKSRVKYVKFNSQSFEIIDDKYYENLSKGKLNLYKDYYLSVKKGAVDPISKSKISEDEYVIKSKYYVQHEGVLEDIRISKKNILKLINAEAMNDVKKFIKENDLSVKDDKELKEILAYFNSL